MQTVTSKDGTKIAYDKTGQGPTVILVSGALQYRAFGQGMAQLADLLAPHFTVIHYDRRGRGDSSDTLPYAVDREIEDIEALIDANGGTAFLYGISSGAALAMQAAVKLGSGKVKKLAMYEAPYNDEETARAGWVQYRQDIDALLAQNRKGDTVIRFMMLVGMPAEHAEGIRQIPEWPLFESIGHTLAYDAATTGDEAAVPAATAANVCQLSFYGRYCQEIGGRDASWSAPRPRRADA
jgi:pimeloyl-ACP methyl ester carboxylesterase